MSKSTPALTDETDPRRLAAAIAAIDAVPPGSTVIRCPSAVLRQGRLPLQGRPTDFARAIHPVDPDRRGENHDQVPHRTTSRPLPDPVRQRLGWPMTDPPSRAFTWRHHQGILASLWSLSVRNSPRLVRRSGRSVVNQPPTNEFGFRSRFA